MVCLFGWLVDAFVCYAVFVVLYLFFEWFDACGLLVALLIGLVLVVDFGCCVTYLVTI